MNDFDFLLHRTILDGSQYDSLIPASECQKIDSGNGNTELSMEWIKEMSLEFYPQMQKVAKVLQKKSLQETCAKIHWFAYNHFQYMADDDDQMLRSPACSWKERHTGIDCKSYSIVASAILMNMELKHYIRKIKQPTFAPTEWTHVYVVVPKDQATGDLRNGYFTIDGTIPTVTEPAKIANKDLFMDHYKLNGASGLNGFGINDIKGWMTGLACLQPSAYGKDLYQGNVTKIVDFFNQDIALLNNAIASKDFASMAVEANEIMGFSKLLVENFKQKKTSQGWNGCSSPNFDRTIELARFYAEGVGAALAQFLDNFFTKTATGTVTYLSGGGAVPLLGVWGLDGTTSAKVEETKYNYSLKAGTTQIPKFEITPYVADKLKNPSKSINLQELLSGMSTVIASFGGGSSSSGTFPDSNTDSGTGYTQDEIDVVPKQAGFGVVGWVLVAAGLGYAFTQMKDKPIANTARKPRKATAKK